MLNQTSGELRIFLAANGYLGEPVPDRSVHLTIQTGGLASRWRGSHVGQLWRIDESHTNPKKLWQSWGSPNYLKPAQVQQLKTEAQPLATPVELLPQQRGDEGAGAVSVSVDLPAFGLAVLDVAL